MRLNRRIHLQKLYRKLYIIKCRSSSNNKVNIKEKIEEIIKDFQDASFTNLLLNNKG